MAEKKKMSVADMLAAARKADSGDQAAQEETAPADNPAEAAAEKPSAKKPAAKQSAQPAAGGARPSVAEMLKMARAGGGKSEDAPAEEVAKPAAKPAAAKPKPAAKPAAKTPTGPKDTASILAALRTEKKPGPITKAEAAARSVSDGNSKGQAKAKTKEKIVAPPMPPKPAYAKPAAKAKPSTEERRGVLAAIFGTALGLGFSSLSATAALWSLGTARFMYPNILTEPPSQFKVGYPPDFPPGKVETKFKAQFGVWIVNAEYNGNPELFALKTVCTHLGCTPNWLEAEQKFKCPCHGSGFYIDGINFEGPAPRPLERYAVTLADDGQLQVDKSKTFQEEMGQWLDPASFVPV